MGASDARSVVSAHLSWLWNSFTTSLSPSTKTTMKTIFVVAALCFVGALALTDEQKAKLTEFKGACITESGVNPQAVENAKMGNTDESDEKLACFTSCMLKKIGILNQEGNFDEETARKKAPSTVPKEQIDEVITKCKDTTGANDCDKAAKLLKCFKENKKFDVLN